MHQRGELAPGPVTDADQLLGGLLQTRLAGECGGEDQARVSHGGIVVEGYLDPVQLLR